MYQHHYEQTLKRHHIPELWTVLMLPSGWWTDWRNCGCTIIWFTWSIKLEFELCRILTWHKWRISDQILKGRALYSKTAGSIIHYIVLRDSSADRNIIIYPLKVKFILLDQRKILRLAYFWFLALVVLQLKTLKWRGKGISFLRSDRQYIKPVEIKTKERTKRGFSYSWVPIFRG